MTDTAGRVAWIAIAPVKSMRLVFLDSAELGLDGIPGDRAFAVIDERGRLVNGKRAGILATIAVDRDAATGALAMRFPDGTAAAGEPLPSTEPLPFGVWSEVVRPGRVALGDPVEVVP